MLSRTADHLYWMARYTERAENTARMLDVRVQYSLMPQSTLAEQQGWRAMLGVSELQSQFDAKYGALTQKEVIDFMVRDPDNPSSIASCLRAARENARAVRGDLTTEVWETKNTTWLTLQQHLKSRMFEHHPGKFLEWVKYRSHMSRGVTLGTMFQDEAFNFIRLGTFLERADNTARILHVKFKFLDSDVIQADEQVEFYYLAALLRSVSAFETYRKVYRDAITPTRVAELLILQPKMPRSLVACMCAVVANLQEVRNDLSQNTQRLAEELYGKLQSAQIGDILDEGLHEFMTTFLASIAELGNGIGHDFLLPVAPEVEEEEAPTPTQTQTQTQSQTQTQTQTRTG
ncbi:alpha-E domain-containing protein [Massilia sp. 9096]|uniref:alpha-E domain-containing protein n=1 Tax=Massilia sp. 9096 TaxID=1500894 RepID=UPI000569E938|nr:alpha-E domain-containing protein [Massilia sp. 9096]